MKIALLAIVLAAATSAHAGALQTSAPAGTFVSGKSVGSSMTFEAAKRKGSKHAKNHRRTHKASHRTAVL